MSRTGALHGKARRRAVVIVNHLGLCNVGGTRISLTLIAQKVKPNHGSPIVFTRPPISHWSVKRRQPFREHICSVERCSKHAWELLVQHFRQPSKLFYQDVVSTRRAAPVSAIVQTLAHEINLPGRLFLLLCQNLITISHKRSTPRATRLVPIRRRPARQSISHFRPRIRIRTLQHRDHNKTRNRQSKENLHKPPPMHALPRAESAVGALVLPDEEPESAGDCEDGGCDGEVA